MVWFITLLLRALLLDELLTSTYYLACHAQLLVGCDDSCDLVILCSDSDLL
jgi:hypothetical protein